MHVAHITSHFASLDYSEVIRGLATDPHLATRVSHRCNRSRAETRNQRAEKSRIDDDRCGFAKMLAM
jgi:hypothetical protein